MGSLRATALSVKPNVPASFAVARRRRNYSPLSVLRSRLLSFRRDEEGSIAILFAFCSIVIVLLMGAALDFARVSKDYVQLQNAADTALLAVAHIAKDGADTETLKERATDYMAAMLPSGAPFEITSFEQEGSSLTMSVSGLVEASLTSVVGYEQFEPEASSQVDWGAGKIEVLLVLDNTGSMARFGRMREMKKAAKALLSELTGSEEGFVKVGIVPFDRNVRVPTSYKDASWLNLGRFEGGSWDGCIADRDQPYDVRDELPTPVTSTQFPASTCKSDSLATIQPLTEDFAALNTKIDEMTPAGTTNITIGLAWGLTLLSDQQPFTQGQPWDTKDLRKVMVLMTDGDNTENRWTRFTGSIDARTARACDSVKEAGATLYTIRLIEGNAGLLQDCATNPDTYYEVEDVDDLVPTFRAIGEQISQLRVSR